MRGTASITTGEAFAGLNPTDLRELTQMRNTNDPSVVERLADRFAEQFCRRLTPTAEITRRKRLAAAIGPLTTPRYRAPRPLRSAA